MNLDEAIAVFDKSAERTRPNQQTEAWTVIRAAIALMRGQSEVAEFDRGYVKGYVSALAAASAECRRLGEALDYGGNVYVRNSDAIRCSVAVAGLYVPSVEVEGFDPAWVVAALGWIASDESTSKLSRREAMEQARIIRAMYGIPQPSLPTPPKGTADEQ